VRRGNEDSILTEPVDSPDAKASGWLGIVADGLGGHRAGDVASQLAVQITRDIFYRHSQATSIERRLRVAVESANGIILRAGEESAERHDMASTITAGVIRASGLTVANVGDSRCYLSRNSRVRQLTQDHSLVADMVRNGEITPEQAVHHPQSNVITRALGTQPTVAVDICEVYLRDGDVVMICSDGLYRMVSESELLHALAAEPKYAVDTLVSLANERGGHDNISVIVVRIAIPNEDSEITLDGRS
jgi:protein phosphatase